MIVLKPSPGQPQKRQDQDEQDDGIESIEDQAGEVVSPGSQAEQGLLGFQDHPGEGLVDADPVSCPGPLDLRPPQPAEAGVVEEILPIVPARDRTAGRRRKRAQACDENDRRRVGHPERSGGARVGPRRLVVADAYLMTKAIHGGSVGLNRGIASRRTGGQPAVRFEVLNRLTRPRRRRSCQTPSDVVRRHQPMNRTEPSPHRILTPPG